MKIISRAKSNFEFIAVKTFHWDGRATKPGDKIIIPDQADQDSMTAGGQVRPSDLVDGLIYVALMSFTLPGRTTKFETKAGELISLTAGDALKLMLGKQCVPRDRQQWRPYRLKLGAPKPSGKQGIVTLEVVKL